MKANRKVIKQRNFRIASPISTGLIFYLFLDKLNAAGWIWGVVGTFMFVWLIAFLYDMVETEEVDIFKDL